jgi:hypothetical protein
MNSKSPIYHFLVVLMSVWASQGDTIPVGMSIDTSPLIGLPSGPFYLNFQLQDGSGGGDANNTITIGEIYFDNTPGYPGPGPGTIYNRHLTDENVLNEFSIGLGNYTRGAAFGFYSTTEIEGGGVPDEFRLRILDSNKTPIPTLGPDDAFLVVDIDSANPTIRTFRTDPGRTSIDIAAPKFLPGVPIPEGSVPTGIVGAWWLSCLLIGQRQVKQQGFPFRRVLQYRSQT